MVVWLDRVKEMLRGDRKASVKPSVPVQRVQHDSIDLDEWSFDEESEQRLDWDLDLDPSLDLDRVEEAQPHDPFSLKVEGATSPFSVEQPAPVVEKQEAPSVEEPPAEMVAEASPEVPVEAATEERAEEAREEAPEEIAVEPSSEPMVLEPAPAGGMAIALTVMAEEDDLFEGSDLMREFTAAGLELSKQGIYHAFPVDAPVGRQRHPLFSISNVLKPGIFEMQHVMDLRTTGVALFFQLPAPHSGKIAFEKMVESAHQLALGLGGRVCDERRRLLTPHSLQRLRDQVYEFEYQQELERRRSVIGQPT